ncbi:MAG: hypothetical protein MOB07_30535 [Acidobacteria bacterium]|nr:hypothetical protein [Acidobacteriota bacterium]
MIVNSIASPLPQEYYGIPNYDNEEGQGSHNTTSCVRLHATWPGQTLWVVAFSSQKAGDRRVNLAEQFFIHSAKARALANNCNAVCSDFDPAFYQP